MQICLIFKQVEDWVTDDKYMKLKKTITSIPSVNNAARREGSS